MKPILHSTDQPNVVDQEARILAIINERIKATRVKDVNGATARFARDGMCFDVVDPLRYVGIAAVKERVEQGFSSFQGPISIEIRDLTIAASEDVAFSYGLNHVNATRTDGQRLDMGWRATVCYQKIDDQWMITHEHNSAPFDVATGEASLGLQP